MKVGCQTVHGDTADPLSCPCKHSTKDEGDNWRERRKYKL